MNNSCQSGSGRRLSESTIIQCPLIGSIQKIVVYETKARFFLVGSNNLETRFKIIKIDRTESRELVISSDNVEYSRQEIKDLLRMIDVGNRPKPLAKGTSQTVGLKRAHSAFGIVGFVRFLEGHYMILITKRRRVAEIGAHTIFKIEDTALVYLPASANPKSFHPDEQRYVKTFQNVDLSSNFYFSYSYDLTNSLQHNMTSCRLSEEDLEKIRNSPSPESESPTGQRHSTSPGIFRSRENPLSPAEQVKESGIKTHVQKSSPTDREGEKTTKEKGSRVDEEVEDASKTVVNVLEDDDDDNDEISQETTTELPSLDSCSKLIDTADRMEDDRGSDGGVEAPTASSKVSDSVREDDADPCGIEKEPTYVGIRTSPCMKFVWNEHLLKDVSEALSYDWMIHIIHGFVGQSNINIFNKSVYLTLIARRSNRFAGTRFLKRGACSNGSVANEVETEQIVFDASFTSLNKIRFTSFVQIRGSIPLQWSQDGTSMVPKPPINLDQSDPYGAVAGKHFNQLLARFGSPIIALDLVKKKEKRRHESLVSDEFVTSIRYLNQFLPVERRIKYIGYDMARVSKKKNRSVFKKLEAIAEYCLQVTGFYQNKAGFYCQQLRPNSRCLDVVASTAEQGRRQHGVVRTNCIDCLDRTNTAQYTIGKCALAKQLYSLGVLDDLSLDYDSDCMRMMEDLYEDQGDTLALQYGGSQLVHRIKGYRKIAPWTSSSRDIMQTLSRYYNNTFSDSDKQNAINLFLGKYIPSANKISVWDLPTDFYLHNLVAVDISMQEKKSYSMWWDPWVLDSLPYAYNDVTKGRDGKTTFVKANPHDERVDMNSDHYRPYEMTSFSDLFTFNMPNSVRDFMPKAAKDYSPFCARQRPGRRKEMYGKKEANPNPNVTGKDSTGSSTSTGSEGSLSDSEGSDIDWGDDKEEVVKVLGALSPNTGDVHVRGRSNTINTNTTTDPSSAQEVDKTADEPEDAFKKRYGVNLVTPCSTNMDLYMKYVSFGRSQGFPEQEGKETPYRGIFSRYCDDRSDPDGSCPFSRSFLPAVSQRSMKVYNEYVRRAEGGPGPVSPKSLEIYQNYMDVLRLGMTLSDRSFSLLTCSKYRRAVNGEDLRRAVD